MDELERSAVGGRKMRRGGEGGKSKKRDRGTLRRSFEGSTEEFGGWAGKETERLIRRGQ
jgi:hypothetical protein